MKNVIITIKGTQDTGDPEDLNVVEFITSGKYDCRDGKCVFTYMESELTGLEGTKTTFDIEPDTVILTREGAVNSRMIFQEGKKHLFLYDTEFGATTMGVKTRKISGGLNEHGGILDVDYEIDVDSVIMSQNLYHITVSETQPEKRKE